MSRGAETQSTAESVDRLDGAEAIAAYLGCKTVRKVYYARERGAPIRVRPGLGLYAFRSELEAWMRAPETLVERHSA